MSEYICRFHLNFPIRHTTCEPVKQYNNGIQQKARTIFKQIQESARKKMYAEFFLGWFLHTAKTNRTI